MKKIIVSLILVAMLFTGTVNVAHAESNIEAQYRAALVQVIKLLIKQVELLQAQLVDMQRLQRLTTPAITTTPLVEPNQQVETAQPPAVSTSTPQVPKSNPAPTAPYEPTISMLVVNNDQLHWYINGKLEGFQCTLNGKSVSDEGYVILINPSDTTYKYTLVCVGKNTGLKITKTF